MPQSNIVKKSNEENALLRRITDLEAEVAMLREAQGVIDAPLPAREALLTEVEKTAHLGSWFLNLETNEVKWSDELFHILGYDPAADTASAEKYFQVLHPDDLPEALRNLEVLAKTGKMTPSDVRFVWKDGSIREARASGAVIRGKNGKVERVVGTILDVTEVRRAERERKQLESQLRQAQKMEVVGRVAGGVAHDFNNLLTIISGNADLMMETVQDDRLSRIRDAAEVGAALTRQLLAFSRQSVVQSTPMDLNDTVRDMVRILGRLLGEDIQIRLDLIDEPVVILADRGQVQQILLNLAVNARDAMPSGGELIFFTGSVSEKSQSWVELSVQDTGMGMDAATQARAFEPFFTTKELGKGTGLGLSTVQDIVAQTQGTIRIDSQLGSGTTVTARFPRHDEFIAAPALVAKPFTRQGAERILLVEDNLELRKLIEIFLSTAGYLVQTVARPSEAEALWATDGDKIDLLISDMVMPEKNGQDLVQTLQAKKPSLKILFISGYSPNHDDLGNSAFLPKPFTQDQLLAAVATLWSKSEG